MTGCNFFLANRWYQNSTVIRRFGRIWYHEIDQNGHAIWGSKSCFFHWKSKISGQSGITKCVKTAPRNVEKRYPEIAKTAPYQMQYQAWAAVLRSARMKSRCQQAGMAGCRTAQFAFAILCSVRVLPKSGANLWKISRECETKLEHPRPRICFRQNDKAKRAIASTMIRRRPVTCPHTSATQAHLAPCDCELTSLPVHFGTAASGTVPSVLLPAFENEQRGAQQ